MNNITEEANRASFSAFYERLESKENIIFMYFSTGLLHYAIESCSLVPRSVNLVLVTTCLSKEEEAVIDKLIKRPHINFKNYCHDGGIWNIIALETKSDFGWLDVDCFIFNRDIFEEITHFREKDGINTLWVKSYDCYCLEDLFSNTYLQFFRFETLRRVRERFGEVTMLPVVFDGTHDGIPYERYYVMPKEERKRLFELYPALRNNEKGLDTTHYYQLLMFAEGYAIKRVRELSQMKQYYSKEALHLGGCHMIHRLILDHSLKRIYYRFNMRYSYYLLQKHLSVLPEQYKELQLAFAENMNENKLRCDREDLEMRILEYAQRNGLEAVVQKYLIK